MVTAILNIGLSSYEGSNYEEALESMLVTMRKASALKWLGSLGYDFYVEDRSHPVLDKGHEPTLVVVLWDVRLAPAEFDKSIFSLCEEIGQWCIAVTFTSDWIAPRTVFGRLVGPGKERYEPFDATKFINPIRQVR